VRVACIEWLEPLMLVAHWTPELSAEILAALLHPSVCGGGMIAGAAEPLAR
jgi:hypothetical protein